METKWLIKNDREKLIIFFNGWGMDEHPVCHIGSEEYDILMVFDYTQTDLVLPSEISKYKETNLIAWSMGVWAASTTDKLNKLKINEAISINGTPHPVDDTKGIPVEIYDATINFFSEKNLYKFYQRMFNTKNDYEAFIWKKSQRDIDSQLKELISIRDNCNRFIANNIIWSKAIISTKDKIVPYENQYNSWIDCNNKRIYDWPHYPFLNIHLWEELISL